MNLFLNLKTSVKLISAFVTIAILLAFVGFFGMNTTNKVNKGMSDMYNNNLLVLNDLSSMQVWYQQMRFNIIFMNTLAAPADKSKNDDNIKNFKKQIQESINKFRSHDLTQKEKDLLSKFDPAWVTFNQFVDKCVQTAYDGNLDAYKKISVDFKKAADQLEGIMKELTAYNVDEAKAAESAANAVNAKSHTITITLIIISIILSVGLGYLISQVIARPLNRVLLLVRKVADGELRETENINTKDEIGQLAAAINEMVFNLRRTVGRILASSDSVAAAAEQISASTQEMASGTATQANDAQTMSELFKELSVVINSVAVNSEQAAGLSNNTLDIAQDGGKVVRASIEGMKRVNNQMSRLEEDSNKIGEIIEVIDDIAAQTNLLALNAAIEAARAGEQGRGFAVVADEVRKLAERSGEATKQITGIIKGMQENTQQSVIAVGEGVISSEKTGEAFEKIIGVVNDSSQKVTEIAAASEEQAAQSSEVLASIESISASTEQAAASSQETAAIAQSLANLAEELSRSVSIFKIS
jgi:methyl-accepting chemotaxis protein